MNKTDIAVDTLLPWQPFSAVSELAVAEAHSQEVYIVLAPISHNSILVLQLGEAPSRRSADRRREMRSKNPSACNRQVYPSGMPESPDFRTYCYKKHHVLHLRKPFSRRSRVADLCRDSMHPLLIASKPTSIARLRHGRHFEASLSETIISTRKRAKLRTHIVDFPILPAGSQDRCYRKARFLNCRLLAR